MREWPPNLSSPPAERSLGPEAVDYLRESLARGKTLSRLLLNEVPLQDGHIMTCVSPDVSADQTLRFHEGGVLPREARATRYVTAKDGKSYRMEPVPNTDTWLGALILEALRETVEGICVIEEPIAKATDPYFARLEGRKVVHRNEVYYLLSAAAPAGEDGTIIRQASSIAPPDVGTVASGARALANPPSEIAEADLLRVARSASVVFVRAYDGESHLVWRRS